MTMLVIQQTNSRTAQPNFLDPTFSIGAKLGEDQVFLNMSSSESRAQMVKPLLLRAGIPAALSIGAYICARIISKRSDSPVEMNSLQPDSPRLDESFHSFNSTSSCHPECEDEVPENLQVGQRGNLDDKLLELETKLEDLQKREYDLETRFLRYRKMKERESVLIEIKNLMLLEKARAEFLLKEITLMENENQRLGELLIEYIKLLQQLEGLKNENGLLQRKAGKHWRKAKLRLRIITRQKLTIEAKNGELVSNMKELEGKTNRVQELEDEVSELKEAVDHLQREKIELYKKLELKEKSELSNPKIETECVTMEEYNELLKEVEQVKKDRSTEAKELTYLRWSNACLRHELMRLHEQQDHTKGEIVCSQGADHGCSVSLDWNNGHVHSKRRRFIQKFKRWVDGGKIDEKEKNEIKCFGGDSISDHEVEDQFVHPRNSCSSV